jgi:site-specific recombinase XerD
VSPLPDSVWRRCRFNEAQTVEIPAFRQWLRESETDLGIYLADAELSLGAVQAPEFEVADVRELESLIARSCVPKADYLFYGRLLKLVVQELTRSGVVIPSPKLLDSLRREKHPCADDFVPYHRQVKEWSGAACRWIRSFEKDSSGIPVALIALCSILWGRALHQEMVLAIVQACSDPRRHFRYSSGRIYADLSLPWNNLQHQEIQRWYADGPLACLIARVARPEIETPPEDVKDTRAYSVWKTKVTRMLFHEIRRGLSENGANELPRDLMAIIKAVNLTLVSYVPQLFRRFWTREIHPRSLWPSSIARIYGEEFLSSDIVERCQQTAPDEIELDEDALEEADKEENEDAENPKELPTWITELLGCLAGEPSVCVRLLRESREDSWRAASPIAGELAEFALRLLEKGAFTTGTRWQTRTIRRCVRTVATRLGQLVGDTDLAGLEPVSLASFYQQAIDLVVEGKDPNRLRESVMMAIREFHRFMVNKYPRLTLNEAEVFRSYRGLFSVDARILSLDDVLRILEFIDKRSTLAKNEIEKKAARFLVVLAFSIGSRRMENFWLRDFDFPASTTLPVIIRPWGNHRLKTPNATRVDHFKALQMPPEFEQVVVDWYRLFERQKGRKKQGNKGDKEEDKLLLRESETAEQSIPVHILIPIVHEAMQQATGDSTVHLHLLRHSAASWTFVRLILSDFETVPDLFPHLPETNRWIKETSKPFRAALYGNDNVTNDHGWAISTLLGQSCPEVPLDNYIHTLDRLSPLVLSESGYLEDVCGNTVLRDASGLKGTFYNRLNEHRSTAEIVEEVVTSCIPPTTPSPGCNVWQNWVFSTHELMRLALTSRQPVYDLAPALNLKQKVAAKILLRMGELLGTAEKSFDRLPVRPHRSYDATISELAAMVEKQLERETQGKTTQRLSDLLDAFEQVKRSIPEFAVFTLATAVPAIRYMDCLAVVGIRREDLRFVLWGVRKGSAEEKVLRLIGGRHSYEYGCHQPRRLLRGPCLTIGPRFDPASAKPALRDESALRFVLELASYRFGGAQ